MEFKATALKIIELKDKDLALRNELIRKGELELGYNEEMSELHDSNAKALDEIIDSIGYPTIDRVGHEASEAAWLIIQHSIGRPEFMKKCAALLEKMVQNSRANPIQLAYLTDRIAVFEGRPQVYGTQFDWDEEGELGPHPIDDIVKVNQRRKSIGLNTLEEQIRLNRIRAQIEGQSPPKDLEKRKQEYDEWRKKVKWIE